MAGNFVLKKHAKLTYLSLKFNPKKSSFGKLFSYFV